MAAVFQAIGAQSNGTASVNVAWPAHIAGDLGLMVIETGGEGTTLTPPAGWLAVTGSPVTAVATTAGSKLQVWYRFATSGAEANVATGDSGDHQIARIITFRGVDPTTPFDVTPVTDAKTTASTTVTWPTITTVTPNALIVLIATRPDDSNSVASFTTPVNANLTDLLERGEAGSNAGHGGGFVVVTGTKGTAGAVGTTTMTGPNTTNAEFVIALRTPPVFIDLNAESGSYSLSGQDATLRRTRRFNAEVGSYAHTGQPATVAKQRTLNAAAGAYSLTGQAATFVRTRKLNAESGAYSLTGQAASTTAARTLNAEAGSYALTGQAATPYLARRLNAQSGSYAVAGQDAELVAIVPLRTLNAQAGSYALTGQTAALAIGQKFNAESGAYSTAGQPSSLTATRNLSAGAGSTTVTVQSATLAQRRNFNAQAGQILLTGQAATLRQVRKLNAQVGSYDILGQQATLSQAQQAAAGSYSLTGQPATLTRLRGLNAGAGAYARSTWADPSYVDPGYAAGTDATLRWTRVLVASAGSIVLTGQPATLDVDTVPELINEIYKLLANRQELDPSSGVFRVYDNDSTTVLYEAAAWEDAAGTIRYRGRGLSRIDRLA